MQECTNFFSSPPDFSQATKSALHYTGAERKEGIVLNGSEYIVKYRKQDPDALLCNHFSEYLGSHIFQLCGLPAQETYLTIYNNEDVVIMKNFLNPDESLVAFNDVGSSSMSQDRENFFYSYEDIMQMLSLNKKLTNVSESINYFWQIYLLDALLGNFDRHGGNWGFIKKDNCYHLAPVYDNGSSLFPRLTTDEQLLQIMSSRDEMLQRVYRFPTSQIKLHGRKSSYFEVISSRQFPECNDALQWAYSHVDIEVISSFIESVSEFSDTRKEFYKRIIALRHKLIIADNIQ